MLGGYVKLFTSTDVEGREGMQLTHDEIDYLLGIIYSRFCFPIDSDTAIRLNQLKDMVLAVRFSGTPGIKEFHDSLIDQIKKNR